MTNMSCGKSDHSLVVVVNKLFVISNNGKTCGVFDSVGKVFVTSKSPKLNSPYPGIRACSIKKKVLFSRPKCQL